jgi:Spy/CpxP family protein refolding chaperone
MKNSYRFLATAGVAAALTLSSLGVAAFAQKDSINPGLNPNTGQINTGTEPHPPSQSAEVSKIPTPEEARAAMMQPISRQPSAGNAANGTTGSSGNQPPIQNASGASNEPPPSGPIGSFGQTIPAKFSKRNDILDNVPIMATPLRLTDEQRKQIYDAAMAEKSQPVAGADALKPTSELSPDQALNGMRPLPESVRGIENVSRLYYIKAKDKVLLIEPNVRTVVAQITPS